MLNEAQLVRRTYPKRPTEPSYSFVQVGMNTGLCTKMATHCQDGSDFALNHLHLVTWREARAYTGKLEAHCPRGTMLISDLAPPIIDPCSCRADAGIFFRHLRLQVSCFPLLSSRISVCLCFGPATVLQFSDIEAITLVAVDSSVDVAVLLHFSLQIQKPQDLVTSGSVLSGPDTEADEVARAPSKPSSVWQTCARTV
ncbi:unnamed protein product [Protopolystoma xenopodis]|uniref:Uncharacterized protein n=1 Tax=Protopolystoma xenopodis TaxID=117903 RepID=A0A448WZV2_9PLAT|nr:unnamed protein product [Protopolystoma xenopodis]